MKGTRLEVLPLPGGSVRRVSIDANDPLPAIVSFGCNALTTGGDVPGPTLRLVAFGNWNADRRELHEIPEARAFCRRLWMQGKPLLRMLSESSADTPAEDRLGLSQHEVSQLGFGWFEVYVLGMCAVEAARVETPDGPAWQLEADAGGGTRERLRAELLQMSPDNPEGYVFDDAANRRVFVHNNMEAAEAAAVKLGPSGVVLVLSLEDEVGRQLAAALAPDANHAAYVADCRRRDLHPAAVLGVGLEVAGKLLRPFAPEAAAKMAGGPPEGGYAWAAFVAYGGTAIVPVEVMP